MGSKTHLCLAPGTRPHHKQASLANTVTSSAQVSPRCSSFSRTLPKYQVSEVFMTHQIILLEGLKTSALSSHGDVPQGRKVLDHDNLLTLFPGLRLILSFIWNINRCWRTRIIPCLSCMWQHVFFSNIEKRNKTEMLIKLSITLTLLWSPGCHSQPGVLVLNS